MHEHNIQYDSKKDLSTLNKSTSSLKESSGIDINTKRKVNSRIKWFTSQIDVLPGP